MPRKENGDKHKSQVTVYQEKTNWQWGKLWEGLWLIVTVMERHPYVFDPSIATGVLCKC